MASLVVADDHPLMLEAVCGLFEGGDVQIVARCHDGAQARVAILEHRPDLAILDVHMPYRTGLELLCEARAESWPSKIILLTAGVEPEPIVAAIKLKVDGLILKGAAGDMIVRAVRTVLGGGQWIDKDAMEQALGLLTEPAKLATAPLTPRESDVVALVVIGRRNKEIARDLSISEGTVKMHLHNLYEKLSVSSRTELAMLVRDRKLG